MVKGLNKYEGKDKRRQRLRNHIAKDLRRREFHQRVVPGKRWEPPTFDEYEEEDIID